MIWDRLSFIITINISLIFIDNLSLGSNVLHFIYAKFLIIGFHKEEVIVGDRCRMKHLKFQCMDTMVFLLLEILISIEDAVWSFGITPRAVRRWAVLTLLMWPLLWCERAHWLSRYILCILDAGFMNFSIVVFNSPLNHSLTSHSGHTSKYIYYTAPYVSDWAN